MTLPLRRHRAAVLAVTTMLAGCLDWTSKRGRAGDAGADVDASQQADDDAGASEIIAANDSGSAAPEGDSEVAAADAAADAGAGDGSDDSGGPDGAGGAATGCAAASCAADARCVESGASYTCQSRYADYPFPVRSSGAAPDSQGFVIAGQAILDRATGLMWPRRCTSTLMTLAEANAYCHALTVDDKNDYHLASLHELSTLWGAERALDLDLGLFADCGAEIYHSATPAEESAGSHWIFNGNLVLDRWADTDLAKGLCVRIASVLADPPSGRFVPFAGDTLVFDRSTALLWQLFVATDHSAVSYANAASYCASLGIDGRAFRLPTAAELTSFVDYGKPANERMPAPFIGPTGVFYWSRTRLVSNASEVAVVSPEGGAMPATAASDLHAVRCVSDE